MCKINLVGAYREASLTSHPETIAQHDSVHGEGAGQVGWGRERRQKYTHHQHHQQHQHHHYQHHSTSSHTTGQAGLHTPVAAWKMPAEEAKKRRVNAPATFPNRAHTER